jgi:hypothetical protein
MIKWLKDKLDEKSEGQTGSEQTEGGEVSEGPNSFSQAETSTGGADSTYGTPDATPSTALGERDQDTPPIPGAT